MEELNKVFGKETEFAKTKRVIHEYLGLTVDYSLPGKLVFSIFKNI